jgi:hypothetical protein
MQRTDTQLNVCASNKRFEIDLFTANFEESPALPAEYLRHVRRLEPKEPDISSVVNQLS